MTQQIKDRIQTAHYNMQLTRDKAMREKYQLEILNLEKQLRDEGGHGEGEI